MLAQQVENKALARNVSGRFGVIVYCDADTTDAVAPCSIRANALAGACAPHDQAVVLLYLVRFGEYCAVYHQLIDAIRSSPLSANGPPQVELRTAGNFIIPGDKHVHKTYLGKGMFRIDYLATEVRTHQTQRESCCTILLYVNTVCGGIWCRGLTFSK